MKTFHEVFIIDSWYVEATADTDLLIIEDVIEIYDFFFGITIRLTVTL